ncbi:AT-rich interactive domain-containing protein 2-like isoform X2 [Photinus pyralis]|uniref:AT-rich interactive domain-containing protein 2-like isoform X2 n=1 Tax=Photinus pyralis TaxID=7054 RepID=UPI0012676D56|nr:AT-rich interactive domain-containing protein 2-like isoform X2 [Photinus pyralis]
MAKILDTDPILYAKERDGFLRDLQHFHETRGTPFRRAPTINGHEIDLYLLYCLVTEEGGWIKVNSKNAWSELFQQFKLPSRCINAGVGLKQLYLRYLDRWEKVHFLGEEVDRGSDEDEESRHKRWSARALHSVPLSYNYQQHNIAESTREYNNLSTDLYKQSDFDRLVLSLLSPLPNEQDFAINVCTLLSNDSRHTLKLEKYPRIVEHLLAHTGIYNHSSLRQLFTNCYDKIRQHSLDSFWKDIIETEECLDLTNENDFVTSNLDIRRSPNFSIKCNSNLENTSTAESIENSILKTDTLVNTFAPSTSCTLDRRESSDSTNDNSVNLCKGQFFQFYQSTSDKEFFNLGRALGTQDYIGQRVLQVASILRNLSFIEENIPVLSSNRTFVRFLILCSNARWMNLQNLGLDMLGNISCEFLMKDLHADKISMALVRLITKGLESDDRAFCIASLDSLNKLSQKEANEEILARALDSCVYRRVCSFLTLQDVMVLVYTLECLYSLSSLGERPCNLIVNIHGVIDTLVSLVTVEGKSYGPKACIGMKLVETVPGGGSNVSQSVSVASSSTTPTTTTSITTTSSPSSTVTTTVSTTTTTLVSVSASVIQTTPTKAVVSSAPTRNIQIAPQRVIITHVATTPTTTSTTQVTQIISPQQLVQQQHAHQQAIQENEQFALAWIRATYEPCNGGRVEQQELYKHYINSCAKIGRRGVIAPLHFPRCVRSVFGGTVGPNPVKGVSATDAQYYEGIKVRVQPLVISVQSMSNLSTTQSPVKGSVRRKSQNTSTGTSPSTTQVPTITLHADSTDTPPPSPASPILKAQLSAPSKSRENTVINSTVKGDIKSQVMAHPHLSQALLGSSGNSNNSGKESQTSPSNTSLIKTLLATKVNDCMSSISMKSSMDCQSVVQVAARQQQQRLLAQQTPQSSKVSQIKVEDKKSSRINGTCQFFGEDSTDVSSIPASVNSNFGTVKREPPQPPPPPLAPLSNSRALLHRMENDDSDSTGNNSLASSSGINVGISSTEDGENSLTSFEGLLNGVPNLDNPLNLNDDSNSKDSLKSLGANVISRNKPLMLADLLEKKVEKDPPILNGLLAKELRIGDKGLELVENHIDKVLSKEATIDRVALAAARNVEELSGKHGLKRCADDEEEDEVINPKKMRFPGNELGVNGSLNASSPAPDSVSSSSNGEEPTATVSTAAAKLFADIAADILEDEEEEFLQEAQAQQAVEESGVVQVIQNNNVQSVFVDQPQVIVSAQPRQIIVTQQANQMVLPAGAQLKAGQTVIVQNTAQQRPQMVLQQANTGQFLLSPSIQGQMQLVASTTQPGQYVLQTGATQGAYVVAQSQTAMVHGQPQTVLVAQTAQQQGSPAKTIIILQQPNTSATHHPKVVVTPQGQQVVVTQVQRPLLQTASTTPNIVPTPTSTVIKTTGSVAVSQSVAPTTCTVIEKKPEDPKPIVKPKIVRDVLTPFVCEWGDCQIDIKFKSANQVYLHVCAAHCPETEEELTCQWDRCDNMKRKRFSLMTHIFDKHCNLEAMKQSQVKRKHQSQTGKPEPPSPSPVAPHPGYAPDAALHAIKRHALEFVNPKELQQGTAKQGTVTASPSVPRSGPTSTEQDDNEGPVTKSMRLTAALILRNLVIYSNNCKRYLRHYEPHLANVALSNVESSRTVAQILYDISDSVTRR